MTIAEELFRLQPSAERMMRDVKEIAKWMRLSGSAEEKRAFDYIEAELKLLGAEVTRLSHDAYISLPEEASLTIGGKQILCQTHSMVASTPQTGLSAEIVYLKNGKAALGEVDVRGKIVLLDGRAVGAPVMMAEARGASGVIFIAGEQIYEMCISNVWGSPTLGTMDALPKIPVISVRAAEGEQVKRLLERGVKEALLRTRVRTEWRKIPLLTTEIKSEVPTDAFVMFSGHVDSWYFGATDNAAANAVMLETGRIAARHRALLSRNLRLVFFSGHSHGRYAGSAWYADHYWEDLHDHCCLNVNADVLGGLGATDVTRAVTMSEARGVVAEAVRRVAGAEFTGKRYARHADQSFWGAGVSSTLASFSKQPLAILENGAFSRPVGGPDDLGWWWHTPEDTIDKIDPENFRRDARIFSTVVLHFTACRALPLDFGCVAAELEAILQDWQRKAGDLFDLGVPLARVKRLRACLQSYEKKREGLTTDADYACFNQSMLKLQRCLVPLNYTRGKLYENDSAVNLPPIPALMDIEKLAELNEAERKFLSVGLVRRRTYVTHALQQATDAVEAYLNGVEREAIS